MYKCYNRLYWYYFNRLISFSIATKVITLLAYELYENAPKGKSIFILFFLGLRSSLLLKLLHLQDLNSKPYLRRINVKLLELTCIYIFIYLFIVMWVCFLCRVSNTFTLQQGMVWALRWTLMGCLMWTCLYSVSLAHQQTWTRMIRGVFSNSILSSI